jgi:5-hydroxyisourate hydrolase-like protein (transthyretin family)
VADLDGQSQADEDAWQARSRITILDSDGNPAENVTVEVTLSNGSAQLERTCITDSDGRCKVKSPVLGEESAFVSFTVQNVTHATLVYDPADNSDPDGDSDGTTIVVNRPW